GVPLVPHRERARLVGVAGGMGTPLPPARVLGCLRQAAAPARPPALAAPRPRLPRRVRRAAPPGAPRWCGLALDRLRGAARRRAALERHGRVGRALRDGSVRLLLGACPTRATAVAGRRAPGRLPRARRLVDARPAAR